MLTFRNPLLVLLLWGSAIGGAFAQLAANFSSQVACDRTVTFTNQSAGFTTVLWNFGDAQTSADVNPTHQYGASGTFNVSLTVSNGVASSTFSQQVTVFDPPAPSITGSLSTCAFTEQTYSVSTTGNNYLWTVTGGVIISGQGTNTITVRWAQNGTGTVQLSERNPLGCSAVLTSSVTVHPLPRPDIYIAIDQGGPVVNQRNFSCHHATEVYRLVPPSNAGSTYQWEVTGGVVVGTAQADSVAVYWTTAGDGLLKVTETNQFGCTATDQTLIKVIPGPVASFSTGDICLGTAANFTDLSTGDFMDWQWNFGDGTTSLQQHPSHVYLAPGTYNVTLTIFSVSNNFSTSQYQMSCPDDTVIAIQVDQHPGPQITCPGTVCAGDEETYSTPVLPGATYTWSVTGGTITGGGGATDNEVTVTWGNGSAGTISLLVNGGGVFCSVPTVVEIPIVSPNIQISGPPTVCRFIQTTYEAPALPGAAYNWTLTGGGTTSGQGTNQFTTYFTTAGTKTIALDVFHDLAECSAQDTITVQVGDQFYFSSSTNACAQTTQTYTVSGTPNPSGYTWNWNVTGGTITSGQGTNSIAVQWGNGPYGTITVTGPPGVYCNSQETRAIDIKPVPPPAVLSGAMNVCATSTTTYHVPAGYQTTWTVTGGTVTNGGTVGSNFVTVQWGSGSTGQITVQQANQSSWPNCITTTNFNVNISNNTPINIAGPTVICAGYPATYTTNTGGAFIYLWEVDGGVITSGVGTNSITVQWGNGPWGTVRVTEPGCNNTDDLLVQITGANVATIDTTNVTCNGGSLTLFVPGAYTAYQWSTASADSFITITAAGTYSVSLTDANGCTAEASMSLNALPQAPVPSATITGAGPLFSPVTILELTAHPADHAYQWSTGSVAQRAYVSTAGTYLVTVTNEYGCTAAASVNVTNQPGGGIGGGGGSGGGGGVGVPCPSVTPGFTHTSCNPVQFTNTTTGALAYIWDFGDGAFGWNQHETHTYTATGNFTVRLWATDDGVCWSFVQQVLNINSLMHANFSFDQACFGQPVQFTDFSGSASPITSWQWNFGDANTALVQHPAHTYAAPGNYIVQLTVSDGICTASKQDTVIILNLTADFTYQQACLGAPALFTDSSSGALPITRWNWNFGDGGTSALEHPFHEYAATGSYNVTLSVTDAAGCTASIIKPLNVTQFVAGGITYSGATTFCQGGSLVLNAPTGAGSTYRWTTGQSDASITATQSGAYYVVVTNTDGCRDTTAPVPITVYPAPAAFISSDGPLSFCEYADYISLVANPSGPGYTYQWTKNGTSTSASQSISISSTLNNGIYTVAVTDNHGCRDTSHPVTVAIIPSPPSPVITALTPDMVCEGNSVTLSAPPGFQYFWSNGATTQTASFYTSGFYSLEITDTNGCTNSNFRSVTIHPLPDVSMVAYGCYDICLAESNTLHGPPGMAGYLWSTGEFTESISISTPGTYNLTVFSNGGCSNTSDNLYISATNFLGIDLGDDTSFCQGGSVLFDAGAGYNSYTWQNGDTNQTFTSTTTGTYFVRVTDANGCEGSDTVAVNVFPNPVVNLQDATICNAAADTLDAGNGFSSYLWSDQSANQALVVTASGVYHVTVTDANSCTATDAANIAVASPITLNLGSDLSFCGSGSATFDAGAGHASYVWQDGSGNQTFNAVDSGTYFVEVTDVNGCAARDTVEMHVFPNPVIDLRDTITCAIAGITLDAGSGFASYLWNDQSANQTLVATASGIYNVTVTDANNCTATDAANITVSAPITLNLGNDLSFCGSGSATFDAGAGYASYVWQDGSGNQTFNAVDSGTYFVAVTDANGCAARDTVVLNLFPNPVVQLKDDTLVCDTLSITLDAGSGFVSYLWNDQSADQTLQVSASGNYSVVVTDVNSCTATDAVTITYSSATSSITVSPDTSVCAGISVQLSATGGVAYTWTLHPTLTDPNASDPTVTPVATTTYYVLATDANGCTKADSVEVQVLPLLVAQGMPDTAICSGKATQLNASGGTQYSWLPATGLSCSDCADPVASPAATTTYVVEVSSPGSCNSDTASVTVRVHELPKAGLDSVITVVQGEPVTFTPNGGMADYDWTADGWNCEGCPNPTVRPTASSTYLLQVTDSAGCSATEQVLLRVMEGCQGNFFIPSAFSPNGDGHNDEFRIMDTGDFQLIDLKVFNRWGEIVFETEDPKKGWDGYYKGVQQELAVFAYYARMTCGQDIKTIVGNVTLVR